MLKRLVLATLLLGLLAAGALGLQVSSFLNSRPSSTHEERILLIPKGGSVTTIAQLLEKEGVITDARNFKLYVRYRKAAPGIRAGEFRFFTDLTPSQVLDVLLKGEEVRYKLTFPEGYNFKDMAKVVATLPFLDAQRFLQLVTDPAVASSLGIPSRNLEGFLFPSTYELPRTYTERQLIEAMVKQFKAHWKPEYDARARALGMSQLEVVSLASVIEKETGRGEERPIIGSVFHNRLKKGMKLESDPTIIYGLVNYDGNIRRADIRRPHPWNTYVIQGVPPTPIANPGDGAIRAALYPDQTDYLYFVATGDGKHSFSKTFAEHDAKVQEYQVRRRGKG